MFKPILVITIFMGVSGCVSIEAPENLVSDTVEVTKDAYNSIWESIADDDSPNNRQIFSHKYVVADNESVGESTANCINSAVETARKTLNVYNIEIGETTTNQVIEDGKSLLECSVIIRESK